MSSAEEILSKVSAMREEMKALQKNLEGLLKGGKTKSSSAKGSEKTPRAPTAWTAWTQHCPTAYAEEYAEYREANKGVKGVAILFAKSCQTEHEDEHADFVSTFKAAHPTAKSTKKTAVAVAATAAVTVAVAAPTPAKKTKATPAPAAPKKEKKTAVTVTVPIKKSTPVKELFGSDSEEDSSDDEATPAVAAPVADEDDDEDAARLWTWKSKKYFRTSANECWIANADGSMGKWAGVYDPIADSMDADAEEPEIEAE